MSTDSSDLKSSVGGGGPRAAVILLSVLAFSCSGGPGSDVDDQADDPPVAKAVVVGNAFETDSGSNAVTTTVRAGYEVVLSGKESYSLDDPILRFTWSAGNTAAQGVQLLSRNSNTVSFTAPTVAAPLEFTLTVVDSDGSTDSVTATVNVVPVADLDRFLTYSEVPDSFTVIASTRQTLTANLEFDVDVSKRVEYTAQDGSRQTFGSEAVTESATWLVETGVDPADPDFVGNPRFQFRIPKLILDEVNRDLLNLPPLDPGRARILERRDVDSADVTVQISAAPRAGTGGDPSEVLIFLKDASGADIPAVDGNLQPTTGEFNGERVELAVPLEALNRTAGGGNLQENLETARMYYDAIDPAASKDTLSKWLEANCFSTDPRQSYHADAHAVYTNNFDLGFGRDMYVKTQCADEDRTANTTFTEGDVASVVINYSSLEAAAKKLDPIIAVAMEHAFVNLSPGRVTTFYTFAPDETNGEFVRVLSADFDNRGEKYLPGNCAVCHGGRPDIPPSATTFPDNGDIGALFLPWDLDSFAYTGSDDPAELDPSRPDVTNPQISEQSLQILADFTRANQQDDFKALNEAVLRTYPDDAPVRKLVHYWYHAPGMPEPDFSSDELQSDTFVRDTVPPGWDVEDPDSEVAPREVYLGVVAQNCRACHTQQVSQSHPNFETWEEFESLSGPSIPLVFQQGVMPLARLTMDRFWARPVTDSGMTAAEILRAHTGAEGTPGDVSAVINIEAPLEVSPCTAPVTLIRGDVVRLSAAGSLFADDFQWQLEPVPGNIVLTGSSNPEASFLASAGREYDVTLIASNARGTAQASCTLVVVNKLPSAADFTRVVNEGEAVDIGILDELLTGCSGGLPCDAVFGDQPATVVVDAASAVNGSVSVLDAGTGLVRFQSTAPEDGQFSYNLDDVDGDRSQGVVTVVVTTVDEPIAIDDAFVVDAHNTEVPSTNDLEVTVNDGGGVAPLAVTASTQPPGGSVSFNGNVARYIPGLGFVGTDQFDYTIIDGNSANPKTDSATVTITVNATTLFATDVQGALSGGNCLGCHSIDGFPGAPDWSDHAQVTGMSLFAPHPDRIHLPAQAASSPFLQTPLTGTNVDGSAHRGGAGFADTDDPNYRTILRWIEEGALDN